MKRGLIYNSSHETGSRPRSPASLERRRSWAAAGRLPPQLASRFTLAEQAVLAVVALEVTRHGACGEKLMGSG
jgi:hypothetical protein